MKFYCNIHLWLQLESKAADFGIVRTIIALIFVISVFIFQCLPQLALAQALVIADCQGFTRATRSAQPGTTNRVEVQVNNAPDGSRVSLTNAANGSVTESVAMNGVAVFEQVPPGVFTISTVQPGVTLGAITISGVGAATTFTALTAGVVAAGAGAGAAAVGVVAAADTLNENSNDDGPEDIPTSPTPEPTPQPPVVTPTPVPTVPQDDGCPACDPDAEPPVLDPFDPPASSQTQQLSPFR